MAFIFHKKPIVYSAKTLSTLLDKFRAYTEEISPTGDENNQYEELTTAVNLIGGGIKLIQQSRDALQTLVNKLEKEFDVMKLKGNRKELISEVEEIDNETHFNEKIASANDMVYVLETRLTETRSKAHKIAQKLGIDPKKSEINNSTSSETSSSNKTSDARCSEDPERVLSPNEVEWLSEDPSELTLIEREDVICRTLKPKQLQLPKFYGDEEEFPEFWAVFETLVHENKVLSKVEKMLLLKDSLEGRAEIAVKGIQLVPKNYEWMINALKKKYGNKPTNRAKIVQKLIDMRPAANNAESCTYVYDQIRMLINQMVSAGQDIRNMQDALWTEKILEKFPYSIVKSVLISTQDQEETKIEDLMEELEKQIDAEKYVESRLRNFAKGEHPRKRTEFTRNEQQRSNTNECVFCTSNTHAALNCKSVTDIQVRRNTVKDRKLCWKCFSYEHSSNQCTKPNCQRCGRMHDVSLCFPASAERGNTQGYSQRQRPMVQNRTHYPPVQRNANPSTGGGCSWDNNRSNERPFQNRQSVNNTCLETQPITETQLNTDREQIVLMTAEGSVWNQRTNQFEKILFFFDTGAQKTLIRESAADELGLSKQSTEICSMSGIGGHTESFQSSLVSLKICTAFGRQVDITAQTKPVLTKGFSSVTLSEEDKDFLQSNELCICNPRVRGEHQNPHILVGLDYYYQLVPPNAAPVQMPSGLYIAKTVFGPSIHGRGTLPTDAIGNNTMTYQLTAIAESAEANIQMPSQNVLQRALSKIFPLEIRSAEETIDDNASVSNDPRHDHEQDEIDRTPDISSVDRMVRQQGTPRRNKPRASKTRAYEVIQDFERQLDASPARSSTFLSNWIVLPILLCMINAVSARAATSVTCHDGMIRTKSTGEPFELCFSKECRSFNASEELTFKIPPSVLNKKANISLRFPNINITEFVECAPAPFCEHSSQFMTAALMGNPHCWPMGAIATVAAVLYLTVIIIMIWVSLIKKCVKRPRITIEPAREMQVLQSFNPKPLTISVSVVVVMLLTTALNGTDACQQGFMRHNVDLVCNNHGKCLHEYNQEVLFNQMHSELCIQVRHGNETIGTIKITQKPVSLMCSKVTQFFTRDTIHKVFHATRCSEAGSCTNNRCNTLKHNETVEELSHVANYPGYSACENTCGGLVCGCFLPMPACTFIRVAHLPRSQTVFEVANCLDWKPTIHYEVDFTLNNVEWKRELPLIPYVTQEFGNLSLTVVSLQKPHSILMDRRYAIADNEALAIPDNFELPVECISKTEASNNFEACRNRMVCVCKNFKAPQACHCPRNALRDIRADSSNRLPITTPSVEITSHKSEIYATLAETEVVLVVKSAILIESADFILEQPCSVQFEQAIGCYNCQDGAVVRAHCQTKVMTLVTVQCEGFAFDVECGPSNKTSDIRLEFGNAIVAEKCRVVCDGNDISLELHGVLHYHPKYFAQSIFENSESRSEYWANFKDIHIPDLKPLNSSHIDLERRQSDRTNGTAKKLGSHTEHYTCFHQNQQPHRTIAMLLYGLCNRIQRSTTTISTSQQQHELARPQWTTLWYHHYQHRDLQFLACTVILCLSLTAKSIL
ncbi:hypothetical protein Y032_0057g2793 [Ancylostoma ceylanicum]|uniref:Peptidase A2 domain-containing protein n=1 Tax=Ancylostoma ceylanicum TaxID=53326 RepID=A0A016U4E6_9BILA|nr:hypothetical protein Y032_0057g2793 [Ancylostoma ceylanicum]